MLLFLLTFFKRLAYFALYLFFFTSSEILHTLVGLFKCHTCGGKSVKNIGMHTYYTDIVLLPFFIDLQQACDKVQHTGLFQKMHSLGIKSDLYPWKKYFLSDRLIQTRFNLALSSRQTQEEGLPTGVNS